MDLFIDASAAPTDRATAADDAIRDVATWRLARRPDELAVGERLAAEPIDAHRRLYLRLARPRVLDGDRGTVTPLRRGVVRVEPLPHAPLDTRAAVLPITADWFIRRSLHVRWEGDETACYRLEPVAGGVELHRLA